MSRRDRWKAEIFLLIGAGLKLCVGEHAVIHAAAPASAVFDDEFRIAIKKTIEPVENGAVVFEQPLTYAVGIQAGAFERIGVVVHLDVADTVFFTSRSTTASR